MADSIAATVFGGRASGSISKKTSPIQNNAPRMNSISYMQSLVAATIDRKRKNKQLPKTINNCLDEFTKNIVKAKSFH